MNRFSVIMGVSLLMLFAGCAPPTFNPEGGNYTTEQSVAIVPAASGDELHYTTDGSTPTQDSNSYSGPISVNDDMTIKAIAVKFGFLTSAVASATYTINALPSVNAGTDITVHTGDTALLSGTATDSDTGDTLTFSWTITARPSGSSASPSPANEPDTSFTADKTGDYTVQLSVSDGHVTVTDTLTVSAENTSPVADAGSDKTVHAGNPVQLDGTGSDDADGDSLTYTWRFLSKPEGSTAILANVTLPIFTPDKTGVYTTELSVSDGEYSSTDTVTITAQNTAPIANAGIDQSGIVSCSSVTLDGTGSTDPDGDAIQAYKWIITVPGGEMFTLFGAAPSFTADRVGTYNISLEVADRFVYSAPDTMTVTTVSALITEGFEAGMNGWTSASSSGEAHGICPVNEQAHSGSYSFKAGPGNQDLICDDNCWVTLTKTFAAPMYVKSVSAWVREDVLSWYTCYYGGEGYLKVDGVNISSPDLSTINDAMCTGNPGWVLKQWTLNRTVNSNITFYMKDVRGHTLMYIDDVQIDPGCVAGPLPEMTWYLDSDGDGYGDPDTSTEASMQPTGYVYEDTDCDDSNPAINPGAYDIPENGVDEDCDGEDATSLITWYLDDDGDGYGDNDISTLAEDQPSGYVINNLDCDDANPSINPDAVEIKDNDVDENCDGVKEQTPTWYLDGDGDGYGNPDISVQADTQPSGYVADGTDCDDSLASVYPGAPEDPYNGIDDNCNGQVDENFVPRNIYMVQDWVSLETSIRNQMMCQHNSCNEPSGAINWTSSAPNGGSPGTCRWYVFVSGFKGDSTFYYNDWNENVGGANMAVSGSVHGLFGLDKTSWTNGTLTISDKWNGTIVDNIYISGGAKTGGYYQVTCTDYGCADGPVKYAPVSGGGWQLIP